MVGSNAQAKPWRSYQGCDHRASTFGSLGPGQVSPSLGLVDGIRGLKVSRRETHAPSQILHGIPSYHGPRVLSSEMFLRIRLQARPGSLNERGGGTRWAHLQAGSKWVSTPKWVLPFLVGRVDTSAPSKARRQNGIVIRGGYHFAAARLRCGW